MTSSVRLIRRRGRLLAVAGAFALAASVLASPGVTAQALDLPGAGASLWHDLPLAPSATTAGLLTRDAAGDLWYHNGNSPQSLVRVDRGSHAQTVYPIDPHAWVAGMVGAPDGTLWFTNADDRTVNRLDPGTGSITSVPVPGTVSSSGALAIGSDGAIWMGNLFSDSIARVDLAGTVSIISEPKGERIFDMVAGPDGRLWYTRSGSDRVAAFDPVSGGFSDMGVGPTAGIVLTVGKSGSIWVGGDGELTEIARDGSVLTHPIVSSEPLPVRPYDIVGGDLAGDDTAEVFFVSDLGVSRVESDGSVHSSRLDGFRISLGLDGEGHLWSSDMGGPSLQWM